MTRIRRRDFLAGGAAFGLSLGGIPFPGFGQERTTVPRRSAAGLLTEKTQRTIDRGLAFLARRQITRGVGKGSFGTGGYSGGVAVCGLAGLAFMCGGNPPGRGPYGKHVERCIDFICRNTRESGYISVIGAGGSRDNMYGHGFATLFLSEVYGMGMHSDIDSRVGEKLRKAVKLIINTQNHAGGWRYQPVRSDADLSITICQIMALRAARDAGINVPDETRKRCIDYVKKSQNPDGGFRYTLGSGGSTFPLTGAGLVALYSAGIYEGEAIEKGLKHLMNNISQIRNTGSYYFYAHYYAAQAMWHAGGDHWRRWYTASRDALVASQQGDGSWRDPTIGCTEFGTAMACIILQLPNNYLPIFAEG
jgi:hypothetical protein